VGGGTGWHITPLISLTKTFPENNYLWIWEEFWLENRLSKEAWIPFYSIHADKLRREFSWKNLLIPYKIYIGIKEAYTLLRMHTPDFVFSKGSHVSIPVTIAARLLHIPVYLHESDTIPWLANRITWLFAETIFLWFPEAKKYFHKKNTEVIGQIINPLLLQKSREQKNTIDNSEKTHLLVICGSQGSKNIFEWILKNINDFNNFSIKIILWLKNIEMKELFEEKGIETIDFANTEELWELYKWSDIAITRWSATTLAELDIFNIKKIIIPLPWSGWNHQYHNALTYTKNGDILIEEKNFQNGTYQLQSLVGFKKNTMKVGFSHQEPLKKLFTFAKHDPNTEK
jgi:UDP-N-acetylglucosamine--N-acetylmuramyl-(pentapeptide) pyrophosphoryl-undecaprenol N-acetylglucosamine transferase